MESPCYKSDNLIYYLFFSNMLVKENGYEYIDISTHKDSVEIDSVSFDSYGV